MNKAELCKAVAAKYEVTQARTKEWMDAIFDVIQETLSEQEDVSLSGFGTFRVKKAKERTVRSPTTGKEFFVPEHLVVKFTASDVTRDKLENTIVLHDD